MTSSTTIRVRGETKDLLDALKHGDQSYDSLIADLAEDRLELSDEAVESIRRGMKQLDRGQGIPRDELEG